MAGKWTWQSRSARVSSRMACFMCRRPRASWPTRTPKKNGSKQKPRRAPCCGRPNRCSSAWTNPFNTRQHSPKENRMLLMLDNYDSFTYNLVQYFGELGEEVKVVRTDQDGIAEIATDQKRVVQGRGGA